MQKTNIQVIKIIVYFGLNILEFHCVRKNIQNKFTKCQLTHETVMCRIMETNRSATCQVLCRENKNKATQFMSFVFIILLISRVNFFSTMKPS